MTITAVSENQIQGIVQHSLTMKTSYSYKSSTNMIKATGCTVSTYDSPGSKGKLEKGSISTSTGSDWFSGKNYIRKECSAECDTLLGGSIRLTVFTEGYADGGYKKS